VYFSKNILFVEDTLPVQECVLICSCLTRNVQKGWRDVSCLLLAKGLVKELIVV
jgi:hypothetical protein